MSGEGGQGLGLGAVSPGCMRSLSWCGAELGLPWCRRCGLASSDGVKRGVPWAVACICHLFPEN